jgi:membrane-associated phospholipid phosphatase
VFIGKRPCKQKPLRNLKFFSIIISKNVTGAFLTYTKIQWIFTLIVSLIEIVWIRYSSITFYYSKTIILYDLIPLITLFAIYLVYKYLRPDQKITEAVHLTILISIFASSMFILSYLVYTLNMPLIDSSLALIDEYLGFKSVDIVNWSHTHLYWEIFFSVIYNMYYLEFPLIIIYIYIYNEKMYLQRFIMQVMFTIFLTLVVAGLLPSLGPYAWYHYEAGSMNSRALNHIYELRQNILDLRLRDGVVAFPSLHAAMAILFVYALRNTKKLIFLTILLVNALMIFSCLNIGEHYLTDLIGGALVFLIALGLDKIVFWAVRKYGTLNPSSSAVRKINAYLS